MKSIEGGGRQEEDIKRERKQVISVLCIEAALRIKKCLDAGVEDTQTYTPVIMFAVCGIPVMCRVVEESLATQANI